MASNVAIVIGRDGDILAIKDKSADRIDGIVALGMGCACAVTAPIPAGPIRFQREGLLVI